MIFKSCAEFQNTKMNFTTSFVLVLVAVTASATTDQQGCCFPQQFEASIGQVNGLVVSAKKLMVINNDVIGAFDFLNNRVGEEINSTSMGRTTSIRVIIDYKKNTTYTIIGQKKLCIKSEAQGEFLPCIPKTAQFMRSYYFGDKQLLADSYSFYAKAPGSMEGNASFSVSHDGCIPVGTILTGKTLEIPSVPILSSSGYLNYTEGITDPGKWFDIPAFCEKTQLVERSVDNDPLIQLATLVTFLLFPTA